MNLAQWLSHFEKLHPVGIDMGLRRIKKVWKTLCQQHNIKNLAKHKTITVAGTNGKGSSCKMLSLLLTQQGYSVGVYTSPHIHHFHERIQINHQAVEDDLLIAAFSAIEASRGEISLSYFEAATLAALLNFVWADVDFVVLETGLGGRLDAVNIIHADATLITSIDLDHEDYLGSDLPTIALEKLGVCRPKSPCIYADPTLHKNVIDFTKEQAIPLLTNGKDYFINNQQIVFHQQEWTVPWNVASLGQHQVNNCAGVMVLLSAIGYMPHNYTAALSNFSLPGRLQKISTQPDIIVDVAHNPASALALANYLRDNAKKYNHIYAVIGMLKNKDHYATLTPFEGLFKTIFVGSTDGPRGFSSKELANASKAALSCPVNTVDSLEIALQQVKAQSNPNDLIVAFGSFLVAEQLIKKINTHKQNKL